MPLQEQRAWGEQAWGGPVILQKDIAAIQAPSGGCGRPGLGIVLRLPRGLQVEVCGGGFSERTVKIRSKSDFFFVLRRSVVP